MKCAMSIFINNIKKEIRIENVINYKLNGKDTVIRLIVGSIKKAYLKGINFRENKISRFREWKFTILKIS